LQVTSADLALYAAAGLALLLGAVLSRLGRLAAAADHQRLLAEQAVAAARTETEQMRHMLLGTERAVSARVGETRHSMEYRLGELTTRIARDQGEARVQLEQKLREIAEANARHLAVGDVQAVAAQIGDLKRLFSNVKTRGGWGETQLRAVLDDLLPDGYVVNVRLREESADVVEFALRMPAANGEGKLLPLDAKFPVVDYENLLQAAELGDADAERAARRGLETRVRLEARKISEKYLHPPITTDFAVMYLPTDGLYAEAARIPGLIDDLGRLHHVLVMGPSLLPALLRTVRLGYVTLALEEKAGQIGRLLGATKQEMLRMDDVLEKLARSAGTMGRTIEDARRRTRAVGRKLRDVETLGPLEAEELLAIEESWETQVVAPP